MEPGLKSAVELDRSPITYFELGDAAKGRIEAGPRQQERLDELTERVGRGEFHRPVELLLPARCIDGRLPDETKPLAPNAAGGSESIFVADDLTKKRLASSDGTTRGGYANTLRFLQETGYEIGGHTGSHAHDEASDCGANDKLQAIYEYIAAHGDALRGLADKLGIDVPDEAHALITGNAAARRQFSAGSELFDELRSTAADEFIDELEGSHREVVAVINKRARTTLDREALLTAFGPEYQAFNVDAWSFEPAAQATSIGGEAEIEQKSAAMAYYNLATALVLGGPKLRVMVLE